MSRRATGRLRVSVIGALCVAVALVGGATDSPVADAAMRGDVATVRALLRQGADVNAAQGDGMTALHWAAQNGDVELTEILLYAGANQHARTRLGAYTPLLMASRVGSAAVIETLLDGGSPVRSTTSSGATALHLAAASGHTDAVAALLGAGADVDAREASAGQTPLMFAASLDRAAVIELLARHGADLAIATTVIDVDARSKADGEARKRRNELVKAERKANMTDAERAAEAEAEERRKAEEEEAKAAAEAAEAAEPEDPEDPDDPTEPLEGADRPSQLADPSAELQARDADKAAAAAADEEPEGEEPEEEPKEEEPKRLSYAQLVGGTGGMTALLHAAREGHTGAAQVLLEAGADIDQVSGGDGTSPLLIATINGHFDLAMLLLEHGADPNLASVAGATPLYGAVNVHWAPHAFYPQPSTAQERATHLQLLQALLDAGADPNARLTMKVWYTGYNFDQSGVDEQGATPFWRAAQSSDVGAMRLLIEHGADPNVWTKVVPERRPPGGGNPDSSKVHKDTLPPVPVGGPATSALHVATGAGYDGNYHRNAPFGWLPAVRYLVEELGFDVNAPDYKGYTPLHNAAFRGDDEMILFLVDHGADPTAVARNGQTTVDMANGPIQRLQPFPETIALLEGMGARNNHDCVSC